MNVPRVLQDGANVVIQSYNLPLDITRETRPDGEFVRYWLTPVNYPRDKRICINDHRAEVLGFFRDNPPGSVGKKRILEVITRIARLRITFKEGRTNINLQDPDDAKPKHYLAWAVFESQRVSRVDNRSLFSQSAAFDLDETFQARSLVSVTDWRHPVTITLKDPVHVFTRPLGR